jgi:hypothetical protein
MKPRRSLNLLPPMRCDEGCGACCGPVPVSHAEFVRIRQYVKEKGIVPVDQGTTCPLYLDGKCSVYPVRPPVCVAFGHSAGLPCERGYNVNADEGVVAKMVTSGGRPAHLLHELLDDGTRDMEALTAHALLGALARSIGMEGGRYGK